jgi:uncharacterized membrane-anchored protein YitT (DUF2179 family)
MPKTPSAGVQQRQASMRELSRTGRFRNPTKEFFRMLIGNMTSFAIDNPGEASPRHEKKGESMETTRHGSAEAEAAGKGEGRGSPSWRSAFGTWRQFLWNLLLMSAGSAIFAVAVNGILVPQRFVSGGVVGLALIIHYLLPALSVAWLYFLFNLPLYAMGWMFVGRRFFVYSIFGLVIFSLAVDRIRVTLPVHDPILSAILAGIMCGAGAGLVLRSWGSAGGTDILSVILLDRFSIRLGSTVLGFNVIVLTAAAVLFSLEGALYTLVYMYVSSAVLNIVVTGLSQRKAVFIISSQWQEILDTVLREIRRGVTIIPGEGGYTGKDEQILFTVIAFQELPRLKERVKQADPRAFVVVQDTLEVMGHRIGNQPHW